MKFKFIKTHHPDYSRELILRWEVLRKPLGLPPGSELVPEEKEYLHLLAIDGKKVVGCVLFHQEGIDCGQVDQMAISEEYHGIGFARQLMVAMELALTKKGIRDVYALVNEEVVGFYLQLGYHAEGKKVARFGTSHQMMRKTLAPETPDIVANAS